MKSGKSNLDRRGFIKQSVAASSGLLIANKGLAKACPPILAGTAGTTSNPNCQPDSEADWLARSTAPDVVWAHDFRSDSEVTYWLWLGGFGDDPNRTQPKSRLLTRDTTDGITGGGCLKIERSAGGAEPAVWWRPFSPMQESGRGVPDNGYRDGMPTIGDPNPAGGSRIGRWGGGNWGPASTGSWDGDEFYLQFRLKLDPRRLADPLRGGKILYLTRTERSLVGQEIVLTYDGGSNNHNFLIYKQGGVAISAAPGRLEDWYLSNDWVTYMFHVVPGAENQAATNITVYAAAMGQQTYTKVWESIGEKIDYQDTYRKAWNAALFSIYHNGINLPEFYQKYDQIIFSRGYIPCPQA